jgi:hypothetical protein
MTDLVSVVRDEGSTGRRYCAKAHESAQPFFDHAINSREIFRAEICTINGRQVVRLARWKLTPAGLKRTGCAFEFGAHRINGIAGIVRDAQVALQPLAVSEVGK